MQRSTGVTIAAIIVLIGSSLTALMGIAMLLTLAAPRQLATDPPSPIPLKTIALGMFAFWMLLAGLGFATGIGLFRLWRWARISMIVFGSFLAFGCIAAALMMLLIPLPPPTSTQMPAGEFEDVMRVMRIVLVGVYGAVALLGGWFIYFFARKSVAEQFRQDRLPPAPNARPVTISIVAWLMVIGLLSMPMVFFVRFPVFMLGMFLHGWIGRVVVLLWMSLLVATGIALFRMKSWAWTLAMGCYLFGLVNQATLLLPGRMQAFTEIVNQYISQYMPPGAPSAMPPFYAGVVSGFVVSLVPIALLMAGHRGYIKACEAHAGAVPKSLTV